MVRRACCCAERLHLLEQPRQQRFFVQECLRLLEQVALVRRTATLGEEQELVRVTIDCVDLDLGRQVRVGISFLIHRDRRELAVAKVAREVGVVDAASDCLLVAATREHELTLLGFDDRRPGVLAHRQDATGGDARVLQEIECNESVVRACLWIIEDLGELFEVTRAQEVGDVAHRRSSEQCDRRRIDAKEFAVRCRERVDAIGSEQSILGRIRAEWE